MGLVKYSKGRLLTAVVDICQPREVFYRDLHEAFGEIEKWRKNPAYSPPRTRFSSNYHKIYETKVPD
jgi:hypothetical protein|tara:strand:+ start:1865 stop:2065 length:201 start_codon:yes stop_codon:yes gene_type:complete